MTIAENRNSQTPGKRLVLVALISAILITGGSIGWIKFKQEQNKKIQQAQTLLNQVCKTDISNNINVLDTFKQVNEATKLLLSIPNVPGLAYTEAQQELNNFSACIKIVNAKGEFIEAKTLTKKMLGIGKQTILSLQEWQVMHSDLVKAIDLLKKIPADVDIYSKSQQELKKYQHILNLVNQKIQNEQLALNAFTQAKALNDEADELTAKSSNLESLSEAEAKEQDAINILKSIPNGTSLSEKSQQTLSIYENKLRNTQAQIVTITLQPLMKNFSNFASTLDASIGYHEYSKQVNNLQDEFNHLVQESSAINNHPSIKALAKALAEYNDALIVWRYCHEGNCFNSVSAGILDARLVEWLPSYFQIQGVPLTEKYQLQLTPNIFRQKYILLNEALTKIWEQAKQNITEAQSQI
ncbi:hypothetical protein ACE1AT_24395 [Pelatocladus sp. BLCC-F211]|uniref:hypothetical protein n=1 Tax=Pelatocladus sp. BLCC-F211 TaxID=3342752 RepID=UPI0035B95156